MRPPRHISIVASALIFGVVGFVMHEFTGPNACVHQISVWAVTLVALLLLVLSLKFCKEDKSDGRSLRRVLSYVLIVVVSCGIWYEIWSAQACSAIDRGNLVHHSQ